MFRINHLAKSLPQRGSPKLPPFDPLGKIVSLYSSGNIAITPNTIGRYMRTVLFVLICALFLEAKYMDSKSCGECHEKIYAEHVKSMHHNSTVFRDEVHKKVADISTKEGKYACALCHMPAATNLRNLLSGKEGPNERDVSHQDGVSCFYCHQINKIHTSKANNFNFSSYKSDEKPKFFGNLNNPDFNDKHESADNPIYKNGEVCMGCHSHKENSHGVEVCNTKDEYDKTSDCISCHMAKKPGGAEKFNKRGRDEYASHEFSGIRSEEMVKSAVSLQLVHNDDVIKLIIQNKMGHAVITQPMRLKFVKTTLIREGKVIWSNFKESPLEDKEATFAVVFADENAEASMPAKARGYKINQNLKANRIKTVEYKIPALQSGDTVKSEYISYTVNPNIAKKLGLSDEKLSKPIYGDSKTLIIK